MGNPWVLEIREVNAAGFYNLKRKFSSFRYEAEDDRGVKVWLSFMVASKLVGTERILVSRDEVKIVD